VVLGLIEGKIAGLGLIARVPFAPRAFSWLLERQTARSKDTSAHADSAKRSLSKGFGAGRRFIPFWFGWSPALPPSVQRARLSLYRPAGLARSIGRLPRRN